MGNERTGNAGRSRLCWRPKWARNHAILMRLACPSLKAIFEASAGLLTTLESVDEALEAIRTELENTAHQRREASQLKLLREAVAWQGYALTDKQVDRLRDDMALGRRSYTIEELRSHPSYRRAMHYLSMTSIEHPARDAPAHPPRTRNAVPPPGPG